MKRGARSIRGALGTYTWVSAGLVLALGLVLWFGWDDEGPRVLVTLPEGDWLGATLQGEEGLVELRAGEERALPPGRYRLTLFPAAGAPVEGGELELTEGDAPRDLATAAGEAAGGSADDGTAADR